jgi:hypothetical protein
MYSEHGKNTWQEKKDLGLSFKFVRVDIAVIKQVVDCPGVDVVGRTSDRFAMLPCL